MFFTDGRLATTLVYRYFHRFFILFHFFSPSRTFLIQGVLGSQKLFCKSCLERLITSGETPFQTPLAILGPPGGHFGICRRWGITGGEFVKKHSS